jgi:hypothetical protein
MEVSGQLHAPTTLPPSPGERAPVSIGQEAEWASELVWTLWRKVKSLAPTGTQTLAVQPVAILTELSQLRIAANYSDNNFSRSGVSVRRVLSAVTW